MGRLPRRSFPAAGFAAAWLWSGSALAHAFGQRYDLPLPLSLYVAGAPSAAKSTAIDLVSPIRPCLAVV